MFLRKLLLLSLGSALFSASPSFAATYLYDLTGQYRASFSLDSAPEPDDVVSRVGFALYDVGGVYGGVPSKAELIFYASGQGGGLEIYDAATDVLLAALQGNQLYAGGEDAPTLRLGSFALASRAGTSTLTVTQAPGVPSGAAVPETTTWATLILGLSAVGSVARRRKAVPRASFASWGDLERRPKLSAAGE